MTVGTARRIKRAFILVLYPIQDSSNVIGGVSVVSVEVSLGLGNRFQRPEFHQDLPGVPVVPLDRISVVLVVRDLEHVEDVVLRRFVGVYTVSAHEIPCSKLLDVLDALERLVEEGFRYVVSKGVVKTGEKLTLKIRLVV
jgi:hypothetical protein